MRRALLGATGGGVGPERAAELTELDLDRRVDLDRVLAGVVDEITRRLGADRGTLFLVDHARNELVSRVAHLPEIAEIRLRLDEGVAGWVATHGEMLTVGPGETDPRFSDRIDAMTGYRTRSLLAAPVRAPGGGDGVMAVLQILNKREGDFTAGDRELAARMAEQVAALLDRTSLGRQLKAGQRLPLSFRFNHIVGESSAMTEVYERTSRAAATDATVLLRGESGSGKELVARAVHDNSARREGPFVKVDCAALPESLIENELFGHVMGAYTGANDDRDGKVAAAAGGTLFLDEIGELPAPVQGKLLRLVQDRTFFKLGSTEPQGADVRFVCATHVDLERAVAEKRFRQDLYYRLRVVEIVMPPLRDRGHGDLDRLIDHFLYELARRHGRDGLAITNAARAALHAHTWPGNVRELENCIEGAVVLTPADAIDVEHLSIAGDARGSPGASAGAAAERDPDAFVTGVRPLRDVERDYIRHVLARCDDNRSEAARRLGIGRNTLLRKLRD